MAGHSKWHNIQHRKNAQDAKRGKIFTKIIREITVAAKMGGAEIENNPSLRSVIDKALSTNMTRDTIDRAVKRGAGINQGEDFEEIIYEGYGPSGVAIMVECLSDNRNRTVAEVRHAFSKAGGNLGTDGSVSYLFTKVGIIGFYLEDNEDKIIEIALEAGAENVETDEDYIEVTAAPEDYLKVKQELINAKLEPQNSDIIQRASTNVPLDLESAQKLLSLVDKLEDLDDVQSVHHNGEISKEIASQL